MFVDEGDYECTGGPLDGEFRRLTLTVERNGAGDWTPSAGIWLRLPIGYDVVITNAIDDHGEIVTERTAVYSPTRGRDDGQD